MPNYQNGKIYTIRSFQTDDIYIGSTIEKLCSRMTKHRYEYRKYLKNNNRAFYSSFKILQYEDAYIELLEEYPCNNKMELCKKEGEYIRSMDCVNKRNTGLTEEQKKEYIIKYNRQDEVKERKKKWENKPENKEKLKEKIICICGSVCRKGDIRRHERSKKHLAFLSN